MRQSHTSFLRIIIVVFLIQSQNIICQTSSFDFKRYLFGTLPTLTLTIQSIDKTSGVVTVNGSDSQAPATPFSWFWGDGLTSEGFFPQTHTYSDPDKNYVIKVIAIYSGGQKDSVEVSVRFVHPSVTPIYLSPDITVIIPKTSLTLTSRQPGYGFSGTLSYFDDSYFIALPRATLEYLASVAASIERDFVNGNVFLINGGFQQVMLRDSEEGGAYSIWYSSPVAFGVGDVFLSGPVDYSSLFHEMGHNFTLNSPSNYYYGGKIDGNANAIFSETMAQIFQHAAGYEIINSYKTYGISDDLMSDIRKSIIASVGQIRASYDHYQSSGKEFTSWNNPDTPTDDTFDTFMTIVYKFMEQVENTGQEYKNPLKRMMELFQGFNTDWATRYAPMSNTSAADTFRATLMVTAVSFGLGKDLRSDFKNLNFPVSDRTYNELYNSLTSVEDIHYQNPFRCKLYDNFPNPFTLSTNISFIIPSKSYVSLKVFDTNGREVSTIVSEELNAGMHQLQWNASGLAGGVYYCRLIVNDFIQSKKLMLMR